MEGELSRREQMTQEMKAHLAQSETKLSSTEESLAETEDKKVALATQLPALSQAMEEEKSRHRNDRIKVQELEGIQAQMVRDL